VIVELNQKLQSVKMKALIDNSKSNCAKQSYSSAKSFCKVANDIEEGYIGAVVTSDDDTDGGYYLIKWTGTPYTDQESGELVCPGNYLLPVGRAKNWYTPGEDQDAVLVKHVVLGEVKMEEFSETNPIPRSANRKKAESLGALKISTESDDFIFDEIHRRVRYMPLLSLPVAPADRFAKEKKNKCVGRLINCSGLD